ncbi:MAG: FAD-binding oxidoreductase [Pirellulaceae bacterium]
MIRESMMRDDQDCLPDDFLLRMRLIYPADRYTTASAHLATFESDGLTAFAVRPKAVVFPKTEEEVQQTVAACHRWGVPFVARGSGTSLSGGSLPHSQGIVIALNRMNRILELDPVDMVAVVEPGVVNLAVTRAAAAWGLHFAPDPSSQQVCTIGGNLAFNAGGAHCLKYGMTSNHVLAARVVLGDGSLVTLGARSLEHAGADSLGLFVGSEGLQGIATQVTLRLVPKPESFYTVLAGYSSVDQAGDAVSLIIEAGLLPAAMEIMDRTSMQAATLGVGAKYPAGADAVLIVELDGAKESVIEDQARLEALLEKTAPIARQVAADAGERAMIWKGRKSVFSAVGHLSPDFIVQDGVVPRNRLGEALRRIGEISQRTGIPVANVFHAGDGNLHPLIMFDGRQSDALEKAEATAAEIVKLCIDMGGSITGEHGVGMEKRAFLPQMFNGPSMDMMQRIRNACDPKEVANLGKMFPVGDAPSMSLYGLHPLEKQGIASRM